MFFVFVFDFICVVVLAVQILVLFSIISLLSAQFGEFELN